MASEADKVQLVAFSPLDMAAGHIEKGEEFEATEEEARFLTRANWAGPAGTDAREIQLEVAAQEAKERKNARRIRTEARTLTRNLLPGSAARGNSGAQGVTPAVIGTVDDVSKVLTNQQTLDEDPEGNAYEDSLLESPVNSEAQKLQDEAEKKFSQGDTQGDATGESQPVQTEESAQGAQDAAPKRRKGNAQA